MDRFVFFGGKGGVGKTTVSAAYATECADAGVETLLVSTDPAHSTADVFDQAFGDEAAPVEGYDHLSAMEIDPDEEVDRHLRDVRRRMNEQVSAAVVNELDRQLELAHRTPGAYEAALFDRFIRVMRESGDYDRVVFDTSPTGGTLRLLSLPASLDDWIERLIAKRVRSVDLFEKAAIGEQAARKRVEDDPIIAHLRERKERFEFAARTLREDAAFFLVLNPDGLSVAETRRAVDRLGDEGLDVEGLVVNRLTPEPDDDERGRGGTFLRERVATEREHLARIRETFDEPVVGEIETMVGDVDADLLAAVADELDVEVAASAAP